MPEEYLEVKIEPMIMKTIWTLAAGLSILLAIIAIATIIIRKN